MKQEIKYDVQGPYKHRPMDWQDKVVLVGCLVTVLVVLCLKYWNII